MARYDGLCAWCRNAWAEQVHHLDHDTSNLDPANLCPLCERCHIEYHKSRST